MKEISTQYRLLFCGRYSQKHRPTEQLNSCKVFRVFLSDSFANVSEKLLDFGK